jgi:vitamin B12 transporter
MNLQFRLSRVALAVAAAISTPVFAQDDLEETIVTATRTPVPVDTVGSPVIVITRNDIERSLASDVSELLQQQAGIEIARTGGPGQQTSLFTRGTESNHTVVLLDGVRINPGTIGGAALQNVSPESLERIEIVKGPRSALYGTDAIGGVVQLFTRGAARINEKSADGSAGATFGTDDTRQYYGDASFRASDKLRFGFGGSYAETDGMPVFVADDSDRGWRNVTGRASVEFDANDALTLRARGWRTAGRTEYSSQTFSTPPYADASQDFVNSVYSVEADLHHDGFNLRGTVASARDDIDQLQPNFAGFDFAHTRRTSYDVQVDLPEMRGHLLTFGVQRSDEDTIANSFGTAFDENTGVTQGFVQDQFTAGIVTTRLAVGGVDHETFGSELTWNAEIGAAFAGGTRVTLAGGKAFRAPDSTDRFGFGGNPDLDPEVSQQLELTVRQRFGEHQRAWISAFDNRIRDLVNFVVIDFNTFEGQNQNIDRARIKGGEIGYEYANAGWRARAAASLQDPRDETTDARLLRRARESLLLALDRDVGRLDLGIDASYFGNRKDFGFPTITLDSYTLVNATVRWRATSALTLQGRLENAFDEQYTQAAGYRTRGRAYTVGVRYRFD